MKIKLLNGESDAIDMKNNQEIHKNNKRRNPHFNNS